MTALALLVMLLAQSPPVTDSAFGAGNSSAPSEAREPFPETIAESVTPANHPLSSPTSVVLNAGNSSAPSAAREPFPETNAELIPPQPTQPTQPTQPQHTLTPGDRIRVVIGPQSEDFTLNPEGEILIRGLGVVRLGARTAAEAGADLDSSIRARGITISPVTVFHLAPPARAQSAVVVIGAVKKSGTYPATTLIGAISAAEGFTADANPTEVRVTSAESSTIVNATLILAGAAQDQALTGGEVIVVPALPRILVSGAVAKPNWVSGLFLSEAISAAGGPIPEADLSNAELRTSIDTPTRINVQDILSGRTDDIRLDDRARIMIPIRPRAIIPNVQVYGSVTRPGTQRGFTLADAVREAAPDTRADLNAVILDRGRGESVTLNATDIALGHALDTNLNEGDRVLIPRRPSPAGETQPLVTVIGDVKAPGQYPPGTITQLLAAAGGVTTTARTSEINVRLPDGAAQAYDLKRIAEGRQPDPNLPANTTVYIESEAPRRESMSNLRTFIGIFSSLALLALRLGG